MVDRYDPGALLTADVVAVDPLGRLGQYEPAARPAVGAGDTAAQRIARLLDEVLWPADLRALAAGGPLLTATTMGRSALDLVQQAAFAAGGHCYAGRDGTVTYRDADWLRVAERSTVPQAVVATDGRPGALCAIGMIPTAPTSNG